MSDYTISIPSALYEKAQRLAQQSSQSVDTVICTRLEDALGQPLLDLPDDERIELQAISYLSDDTLWTIAREQMQPELQDTMSQLMDKNSEGTITKNELRLLSYGSTIFKAVQQKSPPDPYRPLPRSLKSPEFVDEQGLAVSHDKSSAVAT